MHPHFFKFFFFFSLNLICPSQGPPVLHLSDALLFFACLLARAGVNLVNKPHSNQSLSGHHHLLAWNMTSTEHDKKHNLLYLKCSPKSSVEAAFKSHERIPKANHRWKLSAGESVAHSYNRQLNQTIQKYWCIRFDGHRWCNNECDEGPFEDN